MCIYVYVFGSPQKSKEGVGSYGAGVIGGCELPSVGPGNQI